MKWQAAGALALLLLSVACGPSGPKPEIVAATATEALSGFDYVVRVECSVKNSGDDGNVTVAAALNASGDWTKEETIFMKGGGRESVILEFPEVTLLGDVVSPASLVAAILFPETFALDVLSSVVSGDRYRYQCGAKAGA